ncbi:MAG: helix-turn-helix transcriptional regulator [Deltaproteobacteria bacterium]|nr:helix-turn-helix transcriptional regulator [Deltaproteobacteria bacterium]
MVTTSRGRLPNPAAAPSPELRAVEVEIDGVRYVALSYPVAPAWPDLSRAEREIADALVDGWSHAQIATVRDTSPRTVGKQVERLYRKLGVQSRSELAVRLSGARAASPEEGA